MICERNGKTMVTDRNPDYPEHGIGSRIECCGFFGTIKYIGPVEGHPGVWLGIDWDDVTRGKHNGTVNGVQYFTARYPKSGSFVRREKVNFGQSLISSIINRYGGHEDETALKIKEQELLNLQRTINAPFIELVGFEKVATRQSNFDTLEVVSVRLQNVSSIGGPSDLKNMCPNITELDISKNLLISWSQIFDICSQLDHLHWINVSENMNLNFPKNFNKTFPNITVLICGQMDLTWDDIINLSRVFPNIRELRAPYNNITKLATPMNNCFKQLEILDLEGNKIGKWSEIEKLSVVPSLQNLILENIQLESVSFSSDKEKIDEFPNLKQLSINHNLISDWKSVNELNRLRNLEELKFMYNPVLETENLATRNQLVIASIANLKILNGGLIKDEERRGAEYDYIKKYGLEWIQVKNTPHMESFLKTHNRYLELIKKYGSLAEEELVVQPNILQTMMINLKIVYNDKSIMKKLPQSLLVQKLIMLVQKMFRLEDRPQLIYVSGRDKDIQILLDDEMKEIGYYSIQDGDMVIVNT